MRIAFFTDSFSPIANGVSVSMHTIKRELEALGHTVYIIAPQVIGWKDSDNYIARIPVVYSYANSNKPWIWKQKFSSKKLEKLKLDIVHSHLYFSYKAPVANFAKQAGVPLVHSVHNLYPEYCRFYPPAFSSPAGAYKKAEREFADYLNNVDLIVAPSKSVKNYITDRLVKTEIKVLPTGIYPADYLSHPPQILKSKYGINKNSKVILYVGTLTSEKNIEFLLKSFKKVWQALDDVHLLIVGGGDKESYYREIVSRLPFASAITITGFLPKKQVNKIYGACDLTVIPSPIETQSLVLLESFASGTPVVAIKNSGASEFVDPTVNGAIADLDLDDFSDKIISLVKNPHKAMAMGQNARSKARLYTARNQAKKLAEIYESLIQNKENNFLK